MHFRNNPDKPLSHGEIQQILDWPHGIYAAKHSDENWWVTTLYYHNNWKEISPCWHGIPINTARWISVIAFSPTCNIDTEANVTLSIK